jgi:hypothetical protein
MVTADFIRVTTMQRPLSCSQESEQARHIQ